MADIAAAAEISKPTLFKYFASKEELALHRIADHREEAATVVRQRDAGQGALTALHRHFRAGLDEVGPGGKELGEHTHVFGRHQALEILRGHVRDGARFSRQPRAGVPLLADQRLRGRMAPLSSGLTWGRRRIRKAILASRGRETEAMPRGRGLWGE